MKTRHLPVIFIMILLGVFFLTNLYSLQASPTTHAFNTGTGALNVDYAGYLSKHDVVFNAPITDTKSGLTVGNGRVGAQVWNANGLTMQVSGVDASEHTCFSAGLVNLYTNPGMDTGYTTIQQRLSLYDGLATIKYDSNRTVTIMGSPNSEVMGIHVDDSRGGVSSVTVDLSIWDLSGLPASSTGMGCDVPDMNTWKTVSTYNDANGAGLSRGQTDSKHFGYTLAGSVEGASYTTSVVNGSKVRLTITPTSSYTIWIACASRLNAPSYDSVTQAKNLLTSVKSTGYTTTLNNFKNWWHSFWGASFVQYSNASGDAEYLENFYYLSTYMIASGAFGNYPFHFINGVYSGVNDSDYGKWSGAYWYWNQRDVYNSFMVSNHVSVMDSFLNLYNRNFSALKSYTMTKYGIDGIWVPETMGFDGNARHTDESDYTKNVLSTGAEVAQNMYLRYKYTNDSAYLSNTAYPFMKEVCKFYSSKLSYNSGTGKYYMASSNAHETYWNVQNAITDLAAVHALFPITISTAQQLGLDGSLVTQWQNILNNLVAYPTDGTNYLPCATPIPSRSNGENVACEVIWPYNVTGIGDQMAVNTWNSRPCPYDNVWACDAIQAARLGMGDNVYSGLKTMLQKYQSYPNGRTNNTNGEFEYVGVHPIAMNEALLHSYNDKIRVFPALPGDTNFISKFTLLASGGFLVSSEKEANEIKYAGIKSLYGNTATVINPWGTQQVQVRRASDNAIILTTSSSEFNFSTATNTVYVIERTAKLLSAYTYQQLTGTANQTVKSLSGTTCKLGSDTTGGRVSITTFYQDTSYGGTSKTLAAGNYTTAQMTAAGIPDNWVSSIQVPLNYTVEIYDLDNFGGTKWTFTNDNSDFVSYGCNDKMSSVKIIAGGGTPIPTPTPTPTPTATSTPTPGGTPLDRTGWIGSGTGSGFSNAFDGNAGTRWSTNAVQVNGQYFQVDLQSAKTFNMIRLDTTGSANDYPRGYQVYVSSNGTSWGSAIASGSGTSAITDITFSAQTRRYLKIVQTGSSSSNYWSIHEFNLYTSGGATSTPTPTATPTPTPVPGGATLDTCDSLTGWSSHNTLSLDTVNKQEGTGCLSETGALEGQFWKSFGTAVNAQVTESSGYLEFEYYISDATKLSTNCQIEISSSGTCDANEYSWPMPTGLVNGWNHFKLKLSNAGKIGTPNLSAINWFRIYNFVTASVTAKIDNIRFTP